MTIAIPIWQERVSPVLDTAAHLLVVQRRNGKEVGRREMVLNPLSAQAFARSMSELGVDVLLCAALSEGLHRALEQGGTRVLPHVCGDVEDVLRAFYTGQLQRPEFRMPGCWGGHSDRDLCCRRSRARKRAKPELSRKTPV